MSKTIAMSFIVLISTTCGYDPKPMSKDAQGANIGIDGALRSGIELDSEVKTGDEIFADGSFGSIFLESTKADGGSVDNRIDANDNPTVIIDSNDGGMNGDGGIYEKIGKENLSVCIFGKSKFQNCFWAP